MTAISQEMAQAAINKMIIDGLLPEGATHVEVIEKLAEMIATFTELKTMIEVGETCSQIAERVEIAHVGLHARRMILPCNEHEQFFSEEWSKLQEKNKTLDGLLSPDDQPFFASQRDATVAATVIQWLGSPVGTGFIRAVNERSKKEGLGTELKAYL